MSRIVLEYKGKSYPVPEKKTFELVEIIEDVVTLGEMGSWGNSPKFGKLARAYAEMLRYAGCKVSNIEVHAEMMSGVKKLAVSLSKGGSADDMTAEATHLVAAQAMKAVQLVLMDGAPEVEEEREPPGKPGASSKKRTK